MSASPEFKVGAFTATTLLLAMGVLFFVGDLRFQGGGRTATVTFTYLADLRENAPVKYASGIPVGKVRAIRPADGRVAVDLLFTRPGFVLREDSFVTIYTSGFLGEKYVHVGAELGKGAEIPPGGTLRGVDPYNLDETFRRLDRLSATLAEILGEKEGRSAIRNTFQNVEKASGEVAALASDTRKRLEEVLTDLSRVSQGGGDVVSSLKELSAALSKVTKALNEKNLHRAAVDLAKSLERVEKLTARLEKAEGPLGVLLYDEQAGKDLKGLIEDLRKHPWKILWKK